MTLTRLSTEQAMQQDFFVAPQARPFGHFPQRDPYVLRRADQPRILFIGHRQHAALSEVDQCGDGVLHVGDLVDKGAGQRRGQVRWWLVQARRHLAGARIATTYVPQQEQGGAATRDHDEREQQRQEGSNWRDGLLQLIGAIGLRLPRRRRRRDHAVRELDADLGASPGRQAADVELNRAWVDQLTSATRRQRAESRLLV